MEKIFIKNRKGQRMAVIVEEARPQKGLAFVMHGLGGTKDQSHAQTFADAFIGGGYTAVRFDTTNTFGESDGNYEDATVTNYYEDLEDVIAWATAQQWYIEPFCLVGHSLGGICIALYAAKHPEKIKGLAPISTVVSGALTLEAPYHNNTWRAWKKTGYVEKQSATAPGRMKRLKWSHMEDRLRYDLLPLANKLIMPVLLIVGEKDNSTLPMHQQMLFDMLPGRKELHIIQGGPHTFQDPKHLAEIKAIFSKWIETL